MAKQSRPALNPDARRARIGTDRPFGSPPTGSVHAEYHRRSQRLHIEQQAAERGLANLQVVTCDVNRFEAAATSFDRVVSVEMFEHLRNWRQVFSRVAGWLRADGRFFMHVFAHKGAPYGHDGGRQWWVSHHLFAKRA